jgi:hypothetical protein
MAVIMDTNTTNDLRKNIEQFKNFMAPWSDGYKVAAFSYVALKQPKQASPLIVAAALRLLPVLDRSQLQLFTCETSSIVGGITVWTISGSPLEFLSQIDQAILTPPDMFPVCISDKGLSSQFDSGAGIVGTNQPRSATLKLLAFGLNALLKDDARLEEIDSELRSAATPFDGLSDLLIAVGLDPNLGRQNAELSIVATNLVAVDRAKSAISHGVAQVHCLSTPHLDREQMRVGIMPYSRKYSDRKSITGSDLSWEIDEQGIAHGASDIPINSSQPVQIFLSQNDTLFDRWWIFDPEKHINPAYAVHHTMDGEMTALKNFLSGQSKDPANDLERGIALLLSLFRFCVMHYGLIPTLRDGPDLLAFTPTNELLVIDCTTGLPNENNKVSKLISRSERIRSALQNSGHAYIEVLPIIVTTSPRSTIQRDIAEAASHGVVVAAKEQIDTLVARVKIPPTPSQIFAEAKALLLPR